MGEIILANLGGLNVITKVLTKGRQEGQSQIRSYNDRKRCQNDAIAVKGHKPRNVGDL